MGVLDRVAQEFHPNGQTLGSARDTLVHELRARLPDAKGG
jgi:hypothetical protein